MQKADVLQLGLDVFLEEEAGQILEADANRVTWVLAQLATRALAEAGDLANMKIASDLAQAAEPPPEWISLTAAARIYDMPISTLRYHAKRGSFDARKSDKRTWQINCHDLLLWLSARDHDPIANECESCGKALPLSASPYFVATDQPGVYLCEQCAT